MWFKYYLKFNMTIAGVDYNPFAESASGIDAKNVASTGKYVDVNTSSRNVNRVHDPRPYLITIC